MDRVSVLAFRMGTLDGLDALRCLFFLSSTVGRYLLDSICTFSPLPS